MSKVCFTLLTLLVSIVTFGHKAYGSESGADEMTFKSLSAKMQNQEFTIVTDRYTDKWKTSYSFDLEGRVLIINYKEDVSTSVGDKKVSSSIYEGLSVIDLNLVDKERIKVREEQGRLTIFCVKGNSCITKDYNAVYYFGDKKNSVKNEEKYTQTSFSSKTDMLNQLKEAIIFVIAHF